MTVVNDIKLAPKPVRDKLAAGKPMTPRQKMAALKAARELVNDRHAQGDWERMIDGVEHYCLYGAVQRVCGIRRPRASVDMGVSACSLTSTMFDALPKNHALRDWRTAYLKQRRQHLESCSYSGDLIERRMSELEKSSKVYALQNLNDEVGAVELGKGGKKAVLRVLDRAIKNLEREIAG